MLLRREGLPEENELVLCTVTKIYFHSVFVNLDEYDKQAMIHISEISPGRIRNIRDYVKEGKKIICKVLRVKKDKGHIDLSLRRVNESQRRRKNDDIKKELLAEAIVDTVAKQNKKKKEELYAVITEKVFEKYTSLYEPFELASKDELDLAKVGIPKKLADQLVVAIKQRIKPQRVQIKGEFKLRTYASNGIKDIHDVFEKALKVKGDYKLSYKGGGAYRLVIEAEDYKEAEKIMENLSSTIIEGFTKKGGQASFARQES